jgi:UDP-2,4-diacetamido-2,4,6-trideoxy-beta-L-altropyranose hydrolase
MQLHYPDVDQRGLAPLVVLRCDVGHSIGYGHVMRSVTLGAELVECGFRVTLLAGVLPPLLSGRAIRAGIEVHDLVCAECIEDDVAQVLAIGPSIVVVDGYDFSCDYVSAIETAGVRCLLIDDNGSPAAAVASLVVNQNPHASQDLYPGVEHSRLLLGLRYALIRREIRDAFSLVSRPDYPVKSKVLVAIGGTDVLNLTADVAAMLASDCGIDVWAASDQPINGVLQAPADISSTLASSDAAVIGAGTTMWEAAFLGVPTVSLVVADNQIHATRAAAILGVTHMIDCRGGADIDAIGAEASSLLNSVQRRRLMSEAGRSVVDGSGSAQVVAAMCELVAA